MREEDSIQQLITFPLADYLFALPSQYVVKVVTMPSPEEGGLVALGVVQLGPYSIELLDLPTMLGLSHKIKCDPAVGTHATQRNSPFLMVLQTADKALLGVTLDTPPDLLEWPQTKFQAVPHSQRQTGTFRWVSHVAPCDRSSARKVLLLLDLSTLLSAQSTAASPVETPMSDSPDVLAIEPPLDLVSSNR